MCSTMCAFGWDKGNRKVPQCPEKLGQLPADASDFHLNEGVLKAKLSLLSLKVLKVVARRSGMQRIR